jgi:hypothetical protein
LSQAVGTLSGVLSYPDLGLKKDERTLAIVSGGASRGRPAVDIRHHQMSGSSKSSGINALAAWPKIYAFQWVLKNLLEFVP